jgi:hypothetical protein
MLTVPVGPQSTTVIVELQESVTHPLLDSTNSRLYAECAAFTAQKHLSSAGNNLRTAGSSGSGTAAAAAGSGGGNGSSFPATLSSLLTSVSGVSSSISANTSSSSSVSAEAQFLAAKSAVCDALHKKRYFQPDSETVLVHMWTHVYLGWSLFRGWYNSGTYQKVEKRLQPTFSCPNEEG